MLWADQLRWLKQEIWANAHETR